MPHRSFYEVVPYLYLVAGTLCAVLATSILMVIAALLLIIAGGVVLIMRYSFHREQKRLRAEVARELQMASEEFDALVSVHRQQLPRSEVDRRRQRASEFPMRDIYGELVFSDRRNGDRRQSYA